MNKLVEKPPLTPPSIFFTARCFPTKASAAIEHLLGATLKELNVPDALIGQMAAIAESTRNDVLSC